MDNDGSPETVDAETHFDSNEERKRKSRVDRSSDEEDDRLMDDDYELLEENLGIRFKRKFKRVKIIDDDDSDEEQAGSDARNKIAEELFDLDDEEQVHRPQEILESHLNSYSSEESSEDEIDDFIVDDSGAPIRRSRIGEAKITDERLQVAQDIFGVDFDINAFGEEDNEDDSDEENEAQYKSKYKKPRQFREVYEPSDIERLHFTSLDAKINETDIPERIQRRKYPELWKECPSLKTEASWIFHELERIKAQLGSVYDDDVFKDVSTSFDQAACGEENVPEEENFLGENVPEEENIPEEVNRINETTEKNQAKIEEVLSLMKIEKFEVPYILRYQKHAYMPELSPTDIRNIFKLDLAYCNLIKSKIAITNLLKNTMEFLEDDVNRESIEALLGPGRRNITANDFDLLSEINSMEEINDFRSFYSLHYGTIASVVKLSVIDKQKRIEKERRNWEGENDLVIDLDAEESDRQSDRKAKKTHQRRPCVGQYENHKRQLHDLLPHFGMSSTDLAVNVRQAYMKISPQPSTKTHLEVAAPFTSEHFPSREKVWDAAKFLFATQLSREIDIRKVLREHLWENGGLSVIPTDIGLKLLDESHSLYSMKYLKNKPVKKFVKDEFLKLICGERERLVDISISQEYVDELNDKLVEDWIGYFAEDGYSSVVQDWNIIKRECISQAVFEMILPSLVKELKMRLEKDSKHFVVRTCASKLRSQINVGKFQFIFDPENPEDKDVPTDWSVENGIRVMAIAYDSNPDYVPYACVVKPDGSVFEHMTLNNIIIFGKATPHDLELKQTTLTSLQDFITTSKPHVIVIGGESSEAYDLQHDLKEIVLTIHSEDNDFPVLEVELLDNSAAKVYASSNRGLNEFKDDPVVLRQAISLGRRLIDPLLELGQLYNPDEDILCLKHHCLQDKIPKEQLLEAIEDELVLCVNEVGIDFNRCLTDYHVAHLLQFVAGLGPSKAAFLIKIFKSNTSYLKNRTQLVDVGKMKPCVFTNCAAFIKIMWRELELFDNEDVFIEYLDCTRIHPDHYNLARHMARDAFTSENTDGAETFITDDEFIKIALDDPSLARSKLCELDLKSFAVEIQNRGFPYMEAIIEDIVSEFVAPFKDPRKPYKTPSIETIFSIVIKETPATLYNGKLLLATVVGFSGGCRMPTEEPEKLGEGNWQCPVCRKDGFEDHNKVYDHYDAPRGVFLKLDNGLKGYISSEKISDHKIIDVSKRVRVGQPIHCRIIDFNVHTRTLNLTSTGTDLRDDALKPRKDLYYDEGLESKDQAKTKSHSGRGCPQYRRRPIMHPSFHNISYVESAGRVDSMEIGDAIFRPSSKGTNHLTMSWKMMNGMLNHVDILELGKAEGDLSIGRILVIDGEEYEDLDEILTRYVYRMSSNARELMSHKYYVDVEDHDKRKLEEILKSKFSENPSQLHYAFSILKKYPGKFLLSYLVSTSRLKFAHEIITVVPDGFRYRADVFESVLDLLRYFKHHYKDPPLISTPCQSLYTASNSSLSMR